jgi:uncharacterized protein
MGFFETVFSLLVCGFLTGDPGCGNSDISKSADGLRSSMLGITGKYKAERYFSDPKVVELAEAAARGDKETIDRLIAEGVDVNTTGKNNLNPLYWLLVNTEETPKKKIGFRHLLKNGANVLQIETKWNDPLLHFTAEYEDTDYLRMILEEQPDVDINYERPGDSWSTPLLYAILSDRYDSIELLIKYGVDMEKKNQRNDTPLLMSTSGNWRDTLILLEHGANYNAQRETGSTIVWSLESLPYKPSFSLNYRGVDYRQEVVEFLRDKGVEVNPWMPEDEEYRYEGGEAVLYIRESSGEWLRFEESSRYEGGPLLEPFADKQDLAGTANGE